MVGGVDKKVGDIHSNQVKVKEEEDQYFKEVGMWSAGKMENPTER